MTKKQTPSQILKEIDKIVQFWRNDEIDGATYTLLQIDNVLCEYFDRKWINFEDELED
jgi:hypothetical protein